MSVLRSLPAAAVMLIVWMLAGPGVAHAGKYDRYIASDRVCPGASDAAASTARQERTMRCLINYARKKRGLSTLKANRQLRRSAALKARSVDRCNDFSHTPCDEQFSDSFKKAGYVGARGASFGENLAWMAPGGAAEPRKILRGWLYSAGHRQNLFTAKWRDQGVKLRSVGRFEGYDDAVLWVSQFGVRG